jgi:hypothetical protein
MSLSFFRRFFHAHEMKSRRLVCRRWNEIFERRVRQLWPRVAAEDLQITTADDETVIIEKVGVSSQIGEARKSICSLKSSINPRIVHTFFWRQI